MISAIRICLYDNEESKGLDKDDCYLFYIKRINDDTYDKVSYALNIYKIDISEAQRTYLLEGDTSKDVLNNLYRILLGDEYSNLELNRISSIDEIMDRLLIQSSDFNLFTLTPPVLYNTDETVDEYFIIDYDNNKNQYFSLNEESWQNISKHFDNDYYRKLYNYDTNITSNLFKYSDEFKEFIELKLQYFANEISNLFPEVQEVYNEVKFSDESNIKLYGQILGNLFRTRVYENIVQQYDKFNIEQKNEFYAIFPVDFEVSYNLNSNNNSIIYNSINDITVQYINTNNGEEDLNLESYITNNDVIENIKLVSNTPESINNNVILVYACENKTILYQFFITYVKETLINQIFWQQSFALPYVNSEGYWNINSTDTSVYAYGRDAQKTNFVVLRTDLSNYSYASSIYNSENGGNLEVSLLYDPYNIENIVPLSEWKETPINVQHLMNNNTDRIGEGVDEYTLQALLPNPDYINKISKESGFTYLQNTVFVNMLSVTTQVQNQLWKCTDTSFVEIEGYVKERNEELGRDVWKKYEPQSDTLLGKLGTNGLVTTFWGIEYDESNNKYDFSYLKRSDNIAMDLTYMCNIDSVTKYYISENLEPDRYKHNWLVFSEENKNYKNTLSEDESSRKPAYPVIKPQSAQYYAFDYGSSSNIYTNNLNFGIQFFNDIRTDESGLISSVGQEQNSYFWNLSKEIISYFVPKNPDEYFLYQYDSENPDEFLNNALEKFTYTCYTVNDVISDIDHEHELIPNGNIDKLGFDNQYPYLDLSEVLVRDQNVINRVNILSVGKNIYNSKEIYPLYYSYIGTSFDQENKSILHIGTSETNPNLGTKTQTKSATKSQMNKTKAIDIDFDEINLNGNVTAKSINSTKQIWQKTTVNDKELGDIEIYSTIFYPVGEHEINPGGKSPVLTYKDIAISGQTKMGTASSLNPKDQNSPEFNVNTYGAFQRWAIPYEQDLENNFVIPQVEYTEETPLLFSLKFEYDNDDLVNTKKTPYYVPNEDENYTYVSYINLNRLFKENDIFQNTYFNVSSSSPLTYHTYLENQEESAIPKTVYYMQLSTDLTSSENTLINDIKVANPLEVTYYRGKLEVDNYIEKETKYLSFLQATSYTEIWSCPGCYLCSEGDCKYIKSCKFSECRGYPTYEYQRVSESEKDTIKPYEAIVTRNYTEYNPETGNSETREYDVTMYFPNFDYDWVNTTYYSNGTYHYKAGNEWLISSVNPGPKYTYNFKGSITFEEDYQYTIDKLEAATGNSYKYEKNLDGSYFISYTDSLNNEYYLNYTYQVLEMTYTHEFIDKDTKEPHITHSFDYVEKVAPRQFTYTYKDGNQVVKANIDSIFVNVRELLSTHSIPQSQNSIASLNRKGTEFITKLGTNKYL